METCKQSIRINPIQLGALPHRDKPDCWVLHNQDKDEMTISCVDADRQLFALSTRIARLQPVAQAYQLAAALMLNLDPKNTNGGAVAFDVDDDSFLYCKGIEARALSLSCFGKQVSEAFAFAHMLRGRLLFAQKDVVPSVMPVHGAPEPELLIEGARS